MITVYLKLLDVEYSCPKSHEQFYKRHYNAIFQEWNKNHTVFKCRVRISSKLIGFLQVTHERNCYLWSSNLLYSGRFL